MKKRSFPGYDEFISLDDWKIRVSFPRFVKPNESTNNIVVNKQSMVIQADEGRKNFDFDGKLQPFHPATREYLIYSCIHALNGINKVGTIHRELGEIALFGRTAQKELGGGMIRTITAEMYEWYCDQKSGSQATLLRHALLRLANLEIPGLHPDLHHLLSGGPTARRRSTQEIQNSEPSERPFTSSQIAAFLDCVDAAYINGTFSTQDRLLWQLIISEAPRPTQIRLMKVGHVHIIGSGAKTDIQFDIPIIKQHGATGREQTMRYPVGSATTVAVLAHLKQLRNLYGGELPKSLPLFSVRRDSQGKEFVVPEEISVPAQIARTRKVFSHNFEDFEDIDFFTRRFKHTKLTDYARMGASIEILAYLAFQTSTVSLKHYVNWTSEVQADYEEKMRPVHVQLVSAFTGTIALRKDATVHVDGPNLISGPDMSDEDVGNCPLISPCNGITSAGCYTCPKFEAFNDGAHHVVLFDLEAGRRKRKEMGLAPHVIARDDHVIAKVKNVMKRCDDFNAKLNK